MKTTSEKFFKTLSMFNSRLDNAEERISELEYIGKKYPKGNTVGEVYIKQQTNNNKTDHK